jgi:hypothetical protein
MKAHSGAMETHSGVMEAHPGGFMRQKLSLAHMCQLTSKVNMCQVYFPNLMQKLFDQTKNFMTQNYKQN